MINKAYRILEDYFYVNDHDIALTASTWYCFPTWTVNVGEIVDFAANLDGYHGLNTSVHFDMKIEKDGTYVAIASSIDSDTTDVVGLLYKEKVEGASAEFRYCVHSFGADRTIGTKRLQYGYTRQVAGDWWTT